MISNGQVQLSGWKILSTMWKHIWPRDKPALKVRVVAAVSLLIGAKVKITIILKKFKLFIGFKCSSSILFQICC